MRNLILITIFFAAKNLVAQQIPNIASEVYSPQWHNPASNGTWNKFSANLLGASDFWSDGYYSGTALISLEGFSALGKGNSGIGTGINFMYDENAFNSVSSSLSVNYQYAFDKFNISVGAAPGFRHINAGDVFFTPGDTVFNSSQNKQTKFMMDAGIYLFSNKFYVGISSAQLNQPLYDNLNYQAAAYFFVNAGYRFKIAKNLQLFPSFEMTMDRGFRHVMGRVLLQFLKPGISVGAGLATGQAIYGLAGYEYKQFSALYVGGYQDSFLFNDYRMTHELRLTYKIRRKAPCSTCPEFN